MRPYEGFIALALLTVGYVLYGVFLYQPAVGLWWIALAAFSFAAVLVGVLRA
jgi:CDP-diglyceride synthetase